MPNDGSGTSSEAFFNDQARNLFLGLGLLLLETPELPRTIGEMLRQKGYEMKRSAAQQQIGSLGQDAVLERQREDLANAETGTATDKKILKARNAGRAARTVASRSAPRAARLGCVRALATA